jgi:hypothetical protein
MSTVFARLARQGWSKALAAAIDAGDNRTDFRAAVCGFEDDLFAAFPVGHAKLEFGAAKRLVAEIFMTLDRRPPRLTLVAGFADPRVGGYADIVNHRIAIESGHLYRFLVLHESAHLIVPGDRRHGPGFTFVLQLLYLSFSAIPEDAARHFLSKHGLPCYLPENFAIAA